MNRNVNQPSAVSTFARSTRAPLPHVPVDNFKSPVAVVGQQSAEIEFWWLGVSDPTRPNQPICPERVAGTTVPGQPFPWTSSQPRA